MVKCGFYPDRTVLVYFSETKPTFNNKIVRVSDPLNLLFGAYNIVILFQNIFGLSWLDL